MQALRQIVDVKDIFLHVVLPTDFRAEKAEVIVLPINEHTKMKNSERFSSAISQKNAENFHKQLLKFVRRMICLLLKYCIILFVALFGSCSFKQNKYTLSENVLVKSYLVDPKSSDIVKTSSIFDSITYITLPFSVNTTIGSIDKLEIYDSRFYFWDKIGRKIWCFDFKGNYVFQIDRRGRGPGEYIQIYDFNLDKERQQIQILDRDTRKILCYDLNGNYISDVKIDVAATQFAIIQNRWLLYTFGSDIFMGKDKKEYGYNLFVSDSEGNLQERYCPFEDVIDDLIGFNTFENYDQQILFKYARNDTIYEFDSSGRLTAKILFDLGRYRLPLKTVNNRQMMRNLDNNPNYARIHKSFPSSQHIFVTYNFESRVRFLLMHKQSEEIINGRFLENDIDGISFVSPSPIKAWQNQLIFIKEAGDIVEMKKDGKFIYESIPQLRHLTENDNPVIVIAYFKTQ